MIVRASLLLSTLMLSGCANFFTGLSGASNDLSCKAPPGVTCKSVSGIYINSVEGSLPAQQKKPLTDKAPEQNKSGSGAEKNQVISKPTNSLETLSSGTPVRVSPLILRVWVAPWEDSEGDLHDQHYLYAVINQGRWKIETNRENIKSQFRPVYPLKNKNRDEQAETGTQQQVEPLSGSTSTPKVGESQ